MKLKTQASWSGYVLAVAATIVAAWLHVLAAPYLGDNTPFITFFPAVFVTAIFAGFGPTLLAVVMSGLMAAYYFIPPENSILPLNVAAWTGLILFSLFGIAIALLSERTRRNSAQLEREHERFSVTLGSIGDGVIVTDEAARVTFMNSVAEQLTGWLLSAAEGKSLETVFQIINEQTQKRTENPAVKAMREGRIVGLANHTILIARDGSERAIDDSAAPLRSPDGRVVGVVLVFRDVTRQRESQRASGRLAALVDSSEDAIIGQAFDGFVTDWNVGATQMFGFSVEETIGRPIFSTIVPPELKLESLEILHRIEQGEHIEQFETVRQCKDGSRIHVSIRISPIHNVHGEVIGASAIDRDISQRKKAEDRRNARLAVTQLLARESNIETALRESLAAICTAFAWEIGCYWRYHPDEGVLRCQEFWERSSQDVEAFRSATMQHTLEPGTTLPGRVLSKQTAEWIRDVTVEPPDVRAQQARESGLHGGIACPVAMGENFLGVMEFYSHEILPREEHLLEAITIIGSQIGQFIERQQAVQQLQRSERELADFFENAAVGLHWVGPDGIVLRVNQAELDMLGYSREEYVGRYISDFHVDQAVIQDILERQRAGEQLRDREARLRCKDGSIRHVLIDSNVLWENGEFIHTRSSTRDITERKHAEIALNESEERLKLALEAGRMGNWEWEISSGEVVWSPTLETIHGLSPGKFPGTFEAFQQDIHSDDRDRVLKEIRRSVDEGHEHFLEYRIVWPDGSIHWLEARGRLVCDEVGEPVRMVGVCSDITERKSMEEQLEEQVGELADAEVRIRSVVENANVGIVTIDERGIVTSLNPAAERIFGYDASEVIGENVRMLMPEPFHSEHNEYLANYLRTGEAKIMGIGREVNGKRNDGSVFPLDLSVSEFRLGGECYFTGLVRDITERKKLETSLRFLAEASKSLSSLIDFKSTLQMVAQLAVPDFADWCTVDIRGPDNTLQRLAVAHQDEKKAELADEIYQRFPHHLDNRSSHGVAKVFRTGKPVMATEISDDFLNDVAENDEHLQFLRELDLKSYLCIPLKTKNRTLGVISFLSAKSGRLYGPKDLAIAEDLAHRAGIAVENARLYEQLREADRRKDDFLAMLAHELRNPLVPIRSGLDLLAMDSGNHHETVIVMQEQMEHVVRLVDDLLDVSRILRGWIELRKESVELDHVVRRSADAVRPLLHDRDQELTISIPEQSIWLNADPVRLVQVLENLLNNASKYTDIGGRIELTADHRDGQTFIRVRDTGMGIEPDLLMHVFDLFTQSSRTLDRAQGGLGIGLTLVHKLVQMHGGEVTAESKGSGHGSTFTVRLPIAEEPAESGTPPQPQGVAHCLRILVVDDNVGASYLLRKLLENLNEHQVEIAHDGPSAVEKIKEFHPHLALLDIGLPGMDGYQVAREIRQHDRFDDILLVALTGYGQEDDKRKSKEAGFDEHLVKPPSMDQIKEILSHPKLLT